MKQMGLGLHNYESTFTKFPSSGEFTSRQGTYFRSFTATSTFTQMLPYIDQAPLFNSMNLNVHYSNAANQTAAKTTIPAFLCPSNANTPPDTLNYGLTDYMPIAYTDVDSANTRQKLSTTWDRDSLLGFHNRIGDATDGTSNTIAIFEASGRTVSVPGAYELGSVIPPTGTTNNIYPGVDATQALTPPPTGVTTASAPGRWADPDSGSGVSGPGANRGPLINNNKTPTGGPATCLWTTNNCGPNDEPFSLHVGGCHALLGDGTVRFISENTDAQTVRKLCSRADGEQIGDF